MKQFLAVNKLGVNVGLSLEVCMPLLVDKKKLGFKAIAVVAGIVIRGKVIAITMREKSICTPDFM